MGDDSARTINVRGVEYRIRRGLDGDFRVYRDSTRLIDVCPTYDAAERAACADAPGSEDDGWGDASTCGEEGYDE